MQIRQTQNDEEPAVNLMPLIDMVFLLLIFFLVATTLAQEERDVKVQLPVTQTEQPLSAPPQQLIINIRANGEIIIETETIKDYAVLQKMLIRVVDNDPGREVLIRCDKRAIMEYFATVVSLCRDAGIHQAKIVYLFNEP